LSNYVHNDAFIHKTKAALIPICNGWKCYIAYI